MSSFENIRQIAKAAKQRDWDSVDRALEDMRMCGSMAVIRGYADARKDAGERLPELVAPDPVTILDLPDRDGVETHQKAPGYAMKWRKKAA